MRLFTPREELEAALKDVTDWYSWYLDPRRAAGAEYRGNQDYVRIEYAGPSAMWRLCINSKHQDYPTAEAAIKALYQR